MNLSLSTSSESILSIREVLVLRLISEGCSVTDISALLTLPINTVELYRKNIREKLKVHYTAEAVYKARLLNLI